MMINLPTSEKQAFFKLLDEYFESRPHRLANAGASSSTTTTTTQAGTPLTRVGLTDRATAAAGNAAGVAANAAVSNALRDQFARTGISNKGTPPAPPVSSSRSKPESFGGGGSGGPAGLVSQKTLGSLHLGSRTVSNNSIPQTTSTTKTPAATRTLPPPTRSGASVPSAVVTHPVLPEGVIGSATVLYDYGDGMDADDLDANEGEMIYLVEKISEDWWRGMSQDQSRQGIIPTAYVRQL